MDTDGVNEVRLVGRVSAVLDERVLPSGDSVVAMRVIVPRTGTGAAGSRTTVDVIDVACWTAATRRTAGRLAPGDVIEVSGALHRRFFRAGAAVQSRYEVAAGRLTRSPRAGPPVESRTRRLSRRAGTRSQGGGWTEGDRVGT